MVEKKRDRRLTVHLARVPIMKLDPDRFYRSSEWLQENSLMGGFRGRSSPSTSYSYKSPTYKTKEESCCIFHTEIDVDNDNIENARCNCRDSVIFGENKRKIQDQFLEQILANANFDNLPPLHNLREECGTQTCEKAYKYSCKVCYSKFDNVEYFKHHQTFHSVKNYGCPYCNATFVNKKKLRNHLYHHLNRNFYECLNCRATFEHKNDLKKHMRIHQERKWWTCDVCPAKFEKNAHLENHKMKHRTRSSGEFVHIFRKMKDVNAAAAAGTVSVPVVLANDDVAEEANAPSNYFTCRKCKNLTFSNYAGLLKHEQIHARKNGAYACDVCAGRFLTNGALSAHRKRAH